MGVGKYISKNVYLTLRCQVCDETVHTIKDATRETAELQFQKDGWTEYCEPGCRTMLYCPKCTQQRRERLARQRKAASLDRWSGKCRTK